MSLEPVNCLGRTCLSLPRSFFPQNWRLVPKTTGLKRDEVVTEPRKKQPGFNLQDSMGSDRHIPTIREPGIDYL